MADRKIVQLFPSDEAPDSDERAAHERAETERIDRERRETHIREEVAKIPPLPQGAEALATYGARMALDVRIELIQMRVHAGHARDVQSAETREIHGKIDWIIGALGVLGRHVKQHDSVSNEAQIETAAKLAKVETKAASAETKATAALSSSDKALLLAGKGSVLAFAGGGVVALIKYLFFGGQLP